MPNPKSKVDRLPLRCEEGTARRCEELAVAYSTPGPAPGGLVGYLDVARAALSLGLCAIEQLPRAEVLELCERLFRDPHLEDHRNLVVGWFFGGLAQAPYVPAEEHATHPIAMALAAVGASKDQAIGKMMDTIVDLQRAAQEARLAAQPTSLTFPPGIADFDPDETPEQRAAKKGKCAKCGLPFGRDEAAATDDGGRVPSRWYHFPVCYESRAEAPIELSKKIEELPVRADDVLSDASQGVPTDGTPAEPIEHTLERNDHVPPTPAAPKKGVPWRRS